MFGPAIFAIDAIPFSVVRSVTISRALVVDHVHGDLYQRAKGKQKVLVVLVSLRD